jgi:hypothetical protein
MNSASVVPLALASPASLPLMLLLVPLLPSPSC